MDLSLIIPVFNEESRLEESLKKIIEYNRKLNAELIFVDDGSTDGTLAILEEYKKSKMLRVVRVWPNRGKGNAVRSGVLASHGNHILFMDADLATPLDEIPRILALAAESDIVIGSRNLRHNNVHRKFIRLIAGKLFDLFKKIIIPLPVSDSQCGFKIFTREAAFALFPKSKIERWSFDAEILYLASKLGFSIRELPVRWEEKEGSRVKLLRDAVLMTKDLIRIRYYDLLGNYNLNLQRLNLQLETERTNEKREDRN